MKATYIDFYGYGDVSSGNLPVVPKDSENVTEAVKKALKDDLSFVPNGNYVDIMVDGVKVSSFAVPDEAAFENATYNKTDKTITFDYDIDGESGQKTLDLSDLSDIYNGEQGITIDSNKNVSVKYDSNTMQINDNGELEAKSDNIWGQI